MFIKFQKAFSTHLQQQFTTKFDNFEDKQLDLSQKFDALENMINFQSLHSQANLSLNQGNHFANP